MKKFMFVLLVMVTFSLVAVSCSKNTETPTETTTDTETVSSSETLSTSNTTAVDTISKK